jgi:uncharacterized protein
MLREIQLPTKEIAAVAERFHIRKLALFGSVLRDDFDSDSDVDVLVEFEPGQGGGYFNFITIQLELSNLLGHEVDLNTAQDLSRYFRQKVLDSAVMIYERE